MKQLTTLDMAQNELQHAKIQNLASTPPSPVPGQIYFDTTLNEFGVYNGSGWVYLGSGGGTVTTVSVVSANGLAGSVANPTTAPAITLSTTITGLLKGNGTAISAAASGTDYAPATSGSAILKGNGSGGFSSAISGTDYAPATSGTSILKGSGSGGFSNAVAGTDYLTPSGNGSALTGLTQSQISGLTTALAALAPLASPTFTGTVTVPTPTTSTEAANKGYVDSVAQGLDAKPSVAVVATFNLTLSGTQTVDGVALTAGQRVLATAQTTGSQNGVWVVAAGAWTRPTDYASGSSQIGAFVFVEGGTAGSSSGWVQTGTTAVTVDTTASTWTQFSGAGEITAGTGLTKTGNTLALTVPVTVADGGTGGTSVATAKSALGFGSVYNSGAIGDGSSTTLTVTHNLNNAIPLVQVYDVSGANPVLVMCDVTSTGVNTITLTFGTAPAASSIKCVVVG